MKPRRARRTLSFTLLVVCAAPLLPQQNVERILIDAQAGARPFNHFWEQMFGSGRANLSLRESYRRDLAATRRITDFKYVRFHAIFHDENGVAANDGSYNWSYVDQIYDGLLANGVQPFVELSFMPRQLAAREALHPFWYKPIVSPPKDWNRWGALVEAFTRHLVRRYGMDAVALWYFEVWNEPNIDFWAGDPKYETYLQLYESASRAVKRVSPRIRVGGPATAQAAWVDRFIAWAAQSGAPVDFVSTHVYANDTAKDVFGANENIPRRDMVGRAVRKVYDQVQKSPRPSLPIIWSEYNASYMNEVNVTDSAFMGPWLANNIRVCDGLTESMSYWTFSDVFEEQGVVKSPFHGGYGLIAAGGIPKPAFNAFALLHRLGTERLANASENALVTRGPNGALAIAVWNYADPGQAGAPRTFRVEFTRGTPVLKVTVIDEQHGSALAAWKAMGSPVNPTRQQVEQLRAAAALPASARFTGTDITLPAHGLALFESDR